MPNNDFPILNETHVEGYAYFKKFIIDYSDSNSWVNPQGVIWLNALVTGAGGSGGPCSADFSSYPTLAGGGGCGGQQAYLYQYTSTQGTSYSYVVGDGVTDGNGQDSYFITTHTLLAKGGTIGQPAGGIVEDGLGAVASVTGGVGDQVDKGGDGGNALVTSPSSYYSGGGGGAGDGNDASGATAGAGASYYQGGGGSGRSNTVAAGNTGNPPGGGGGGATAIQDIGSGNSGGKGGNGYLAIQHLTTHLMFF